MFYLDRLKSVARSHLRPPYNFTLIADFLIVASAGSAGVGLNVYGGGGGAGGLICSGQALQGGGGSAQSSIALAKGTYAIVVAGETVGVNNQYRGVVGSNSSAFGHTAIGGGLGGGSGPPAGGDGGSGGGGPGGDYGYQTTGGTGTANQGYGGGASGSNITPAVPLGWGASGGGGGGGAGGAGGNASATPTVYPSNPQYYQHGGTGGLGLEWIDGKVYACGGPGGAGGVGGATQGPHAANYPSGGQPNRGFGGDIGRTDAKSTVKGYGGAGVVIIRYSANQGFTTSGGTQTRVGAYIYETFIASTTLTVS